MSATTLKDRLNTAFMSIRKNILTGDDARAFKTLKAIVNSEKRKTKKEVV